MNVLQHVSRRELQRLCKKYGIPANKTNQAMVEALQKTSEKMKNNDDILNNRGSSNSSNSNSNSCDHLSQLFQGMSHLEVEFLASAELGFNDDNDNNDDDNDDDINNNDDELLDFLTPRIPHYLSDISRSTNTGTSTSTTNSNSSSSSSSSMSADHHRFLSNFTLDQQQKSLATTTTNLMSMSESATTIGSPFFDESTAGTDSPSFMGRRETEAETAEAQQLQQQQSECESDDDDLLINHNIMMCYEKFGAMTNHGSQQCFGSQQATNNFGSQSFYSPPRETSCAYSYSRRALMSPLSEDNNTSTKENNISMAMDSNERRKQARLERLLQSGTPAAPEKKQYTLARTTKAQRALKLRMSEKRRTRQQHYFSSKRRLNYAQDMLNNNHQQKKNQNQKNQKRSQMSFCSQPPPDFQKNKNKEIKTRPRRRRRGIKRRMPNEFITADEEDMSSLKVNQPSFKRTRLC